MQNTRNEELIKTLTDVIEGESRFAEEINEESKSAKAANRAVQSRDDMSTETKMLALINVHVLCVAYGDSCRQIDNWEIELVKAGLSSKEASDLIKKMQKNAKAHCKAQKQRKK